MIIEFSNTKVVASHSPMAVAVIVSVCVLFVIPTTLVLLGYYQTQPTGTLISPMPTGPISQVISPTPTQSTPNLPLVASDNPIENQTDEATISSNIKDKTAIIASGQTEVKIKDDQISENSQIYLSPRPGDKSIYSVRSKSQGEFILQTNSPSITDRYIDYHIVNP